MKDLPQFLQNMLAAPPPAGSGVHKWMFCVARQLHCHMPATEIIALLERAVAQCGRPVPRREIVAAVTDSIPVAYQPNRDSDPLPTAPKKWPAVNHSLQQRILQDRFGLADLWELSNPPIEDNEPHTEDIIDRLFPGNPLLCCGHSSASFQTLPREIWRGKLQSLQFIVPSPMSAPTGHRKADGKTSAHTLENTGPRRFLVCEFDHGTLNDQACLIRHLANYGPLVIAVHSGKKSLHGWFLVANQPPDKISAFFRYAVSIGADPATWTPSQFVRMPGGTRPIDNSTPVRQTVYYLNLNPLKP